jgi:hypothetical protein
LNLESVASLDVYDMFTCLLFTSIMSLHTT